MPWRLVKDPKFYPKLPSLPKLPQLPRLPKLPKLPQLRPLKPLGPLWVRSMFGEISKLVAYKGRIIRANLELNYGKI